MGQPASLISWPESIFWILNVYNNFKDMSGKKSALEAPKTGVSEDARGRRTWDRKEFSVMAENRLKKYEVQNNY